MQRPRASDPQHPSQDDPASASKSEDSSSREAHHDIPGSVAKARLVAEDVLMEE
jgi:hypothetical protein